MYGAGATVTLLLSQPEMLPAIAGTDASMHAAIPALTMFLIIFPLFTLLLLFNCLIIFSNRHIKTLLTTFPFFFRFVNFSNL
ncbi:MAG: hypothetical protein A2X80_02135 [Geobacteraceae bacterium GWB2_52_12]|nr:MAG: hypothetical protein A2X80_02135 [Geobacteraceae bacterium GWB2_52_12]